MLRHRNWTDKKDSFGHIFWIWRRFPFFRSVSFIIPTKYGDIVVRQIICTSSLFQRRNIRPRSIGRTYPHFLLRGGCGMEKIRHPWTSRPPSSHKLQKTDPILFSTVIMSHFLSHILLKSHFFPQLYFSTLKYFLFGEVQSQREI